MKNVLIITYYWPPAGGSGVQRWLKFVKYLPEFGIKPIVYTAGKKSFPIEDLSLLSEIPKETHVIKKSIVEPENLFSLFGNNNSEGSGFLEVNPSLWGRFKQYVRANFFIPDARKMWVNPSVSYLKDVVKNENIDLIVSTGPPHSLHLIGLKLKELTGVKWIADFRDPWTEIDYFHKLPLTTKSLQKHHSLEKEVVSKADAVLVVGDTMNEAYQKWNESVYTVTNGFDSDLSDSEKVLDERFTMTHIGMMNADRNPSILWEALSELTLENETFNTDFQLNLVGKIDPSVIESITKFGLASNLQKLDYRPHGEIIDLQKKSQCLLLVINNVPSAKGIVTGKLFEYLASQRPILAIGPEDGDLAKILEASAAGVIVGFDNKEKLKRQILKFYNSYKSDRLEVKSRNVQQYHRKELTGKVVSIIETLLK